MATTNFHAKSTAMEVVQGLNANLQGKLAIVTGGTSGREELIFDILLFMLIVLGIGVETARALAAAHAHVIITARDMTRGDEVVADLKNSTGNDQVEVMELDLNSLQSVRNFVEQFRARNLPINILICKSSIRLSIH